MQAIEERFKWYEGRPPMVVGAVVGIFWMLELTLGIFLLAGFQRVMLVFLILIPCGIWVGSQLDAKRTFKVGVRVAGFVLLLLVYGALSHWLS
jgi:hypothetical protein